MDFESLESAQQFVDESVAIIDAHLRRGAAGHRALLQQLSEMSKHQERIEMLLAQSEWEARKVGYRWLRLLVERESEVVAFVDALCRAAADSPEWFEELDPSTLEFLTDLVGHLIPGMASNQDLARMRRNLARVLEQAPGSRPRAIEERITGLRVLHDAWAGPLGVEDARALLLNPNIEADEKFEILKRSPVAATADVDLAAILGAALHEQEEDDVIAQIERFRLGERDLRLLDEAMFADVSTDESARWMLGAYLLATGRKEWAAKQIWFEEAIRRGGAVRSGMIHGLRSVEGVDKAFVQRLLALPDLAQGERRALEAVLAGDENGR